MSTPQWSNEISVFSPEIDAEHRELLRVAEDLRQAVCGGADAAQASQKARALLAEMEDHFASEERQMKSAHYSGVGWHKGQHDGIRKRGAALEEAAAHGDRKAVLEFVKYLREWLVGHVAVADRMMASHMRNHERARGQGS